MNRADEHLGKARELSEFLMYRPNDLRFRFCGCFISESESDDVARFQPASIRSQQAHHSRATTSVLLDSAIN
jgi:hypothetical protein